VRVETHGGSFLGFGHYGGPFRIQHNHLILGSGHSGGGSSGFGHSVLDSPPTNFFF
jgi:hypothetical protein